MTISPVSKTVVLIDDDPDDVDIMQEALLRLDNSVVYIPFMDPCEALQAVTHELVLLPNYIFIDINMPGLTGDKCLTEFRKHAHLNDVVITMFSTSMPHQVAESLKKDGANFAFQKPSRFEEYEAILTEIFQAQPLHP